MADTAYVGVTQYLTCRFAVDEVQELSSTATGGTFTITTKDGIYSLPFNATTTDVEAVMPGVHATGGPLNTNPLQIRWVGGRKGTALPLSTLGTAGLTGGTATITEAQAGGPILLTSPPTVTVRDSRGNVTVLSSISDGGGGDYTAEFTPTTPRIHHWTAEGVSGTHGPVIARGWFDART